MWWRRFRWMRRRNRIGRREDGELGSLRRSRGGKFTRRQPRFHYSRAPASALVSRRTAWKAQETAGLDCIERGLRRGDSWGFHLEGFSGVILMPILAIVVIAMGSVWLGWIAWLDEV